MKEKLLRSLVKEIIFENSTLPSSKRGRISKWGKEQEKKTPHSWSKTYPLSKMKISTEVRYYPPDSSNPFSPDIGYLYAWVNGEAVGQLVMNKSTQEEHIDKVSFDIEVDPDFRRLGIATIMIKAAEELLGKKTIPSSFGMHSDRMPTQDAHSFWKSRTGINDL
jgi:ribosomal protein S18 acetylase RimI-like enzyme